MAQQATAVNRAACSHHLQNIAAVATGVTHREHAGTQERGQRAAADEEEHEGEDAGGNPPAELRVEEPVEAGAW